jgi:hypothetical protein
VSNERDYIMQKLFDATTIDDEDVKTTAMQIFVEIGK